MGSFLSEKKALEFEDEKVEYIPKFTKNGIECALVDLKIATRFQVTIPLITQISRTMPNEASSGDKFGNRFDCRGRGKTKP